MTFIQRKDFASVLFLRRRILGYVRAHMSCKYIPPVHMKFCQGVNNFLVFYREQKLPCRTSQAVAGPYT